MRSYSKVQILAIIGTLSFCVLLYFAPNKPEKKDNSTVNSTDSKIEKAISLVSGNNPMEGIMLLREVLAEDSMNTKANFQLGLFSIQSSQYDKAVSRFLKVIEMDSSQQKAKFYLGLSYYSLGNKKDALRNFESYLVSPDDNNLKDEARKYINELKK